MKHYILDSEGSPVVCEDLSEWAAWMGQNPERRKLAQDLLLSGRRVSTVFLGTDHDFSETGPPLLFETMVFPPDSFSDLDMERYSTRDEALIGHTVMLAKWTLQEERDGREGKEGLS